MTEREGDCERAGGDRLNERGEESERETERGGERERDCMFCFLDTQKANLPANISPLLRRGASEVSASQHAPKSDSIIFVD